MYEFAYQAPTTLDAALALLAESDEAKPLAGGMTLIPTLKQRLAQPSLLVDLGGIAGLRGVSVAESGLSLGAMTTHAEVAASPLVRAEWPAVAALAGQIGDAQVRHRGTIGGSIANNDPAADYPAALLALGAEITTDRRRLAAQDFFLGLFETALEPGEIVTRVTFPRARRAAYEKLHNPASRYAVVGVFVAEMPGGFRVAVTGAGPGVFRLPAFEAALDADPQPGALTGLTVNPDDLNNDLHASAAYRAHVIPVLARRAVSALIPAVP